MMEVRKEVATSAALDAGETWKLGPSLFVANSSSKAVAALAIPAAVRKLPAPGRLATGDLASEQRGRVGLALRPTRR